MELNKVALDKYIERGPPDDSPYFEAVHEAFSDKFWDANEQWITNDPADQCNTWIDKCMTTEHAPEDTARLIEKMHYVLNIQEVTSKFEKVDIMGSEILFLGEGKKHQAYNTPFLFESNPIIKKVPKLVAFNANETLAVLKKAYVKLQELSNRNMDTSVETNLLRAAIRNEISESENRPGEDVQLECEATAINLNLPKTESNENTD